ncbi:acyltransferase GLAUCE-like [Cornus florida]|uniref:acyltransferase GLAUCE-like n=1 Tax=Cornus florida TaxID=4283 RepID=UPI0028A1C614|nr:acyltransferase GLAUCE-like [Cornus florida]
MEKVKLVEKVVIVPEKLTEKRRIFLSNIDLGLVAYQESVSFFDPPQMSFSQACKYFYCALGRLFVDYDFFAGRLVPSMEDSRRLEIDCNGAGVVVAAATTETELRQLGNLTASKPEFKQFVACLHEKGEEQMEITHMPLLFLQLTQLKCGSLAMASRYNHCIMDGVAIHEFASNMAALTRGEEMVVVPNPDRMIFKARNPPEINHPHYEYSKATETDDLYTARCHDTTIEQSSLQHCHTHLIHLSRQRIANLKKAVLRKGRLKNCTTFQVVAAKIWKARSIAMEMHDEKTSTMLFPVNVRKMVVPQAPVGFAGNALINGFARASVRELKEEEDYVFVKKVQEGIERLDDEYVRSSIDWLEVNKGVPCRENTFSLVAWWRLGLEQNEFVWGRSKCDTTVVIKPGLVFLLPEQKGEGGLNICLELPENQMEEFHRLMMED